MAVDESQTNGAVFVGTGNWVLCCQPLGLFQNRGKVSFLFKALLFRSFTVDAFGATYDQHLP